MKQEKIGAITILIKSRQTHAASVQKILTEYGHVILARLGVNVQPLCVKNCTGLITVVVRGEAKKINALKNELDKLYGIVAKKVLF